MNQAKKKEIHTALKIPEFKKDEKVEINPDEVSSSESEKDDEQGQ